jgi:NADH:ubiquinone oxidoreductase subunit 5 (subunit L)/multisubunit Na+/H+ antiporter MnhA subunit
MFDIVENLSEIVSFVRTILDASISLSTGRPFFSEFYSKDLITEFSYISKVKNIFYVYDTNFPIFNSCTSRVFISLFIFYRVRFTSIGSFYEKRLIRFVKTVVSNYKGN